MTDILTTEQQIELNNSNSCYMIGTLAHGDSSYSELFKEQNTINTNNTSLEFYIKPLSSEPIPITRYLHNQGLYKGIDSIQLRDQMPKGFATESVGKKKQILLSMLENHPVIFKVKVSYSKPGIPYKGMEIVNIEKDISITDRVNYIPVPKISSSYIDFEQKLRDKNFILLEQYYNSMPEPYYIFCDSYIYYGFKWIKHDINNKMWKSSEGLNGIYKVALKLDSVSEKNKIIRASTNFLFIEDTFIIDAVDNAPAETKIVLEQPATERLDKEIMEDLNSITVQNEYYFINAFEEYTKLRALTYKKEDLVNLHTCVKTNMLTILAGMSGTGKSKLAQAYADMLDLSEANHTLLFLPISPSFTEPGDILGYYNGINGLFVPSETGLVDFLKHAQDNPEQMHICVLDELNLGQIEHYFAPFISILERDSLEEDDENEFLIEDDDKRKLTLYSKRVNCINSERYPDCITIGNNIRFIGTVNLDETVKDFSDRLLDRANVIYLNKKTLFDYKSEQEDRFGKFSSKKDYYKYKCNSMKTYKSWINGGDGISFYNDEECKFLDKLHKNINDYDKQKGVSFRIAKKIGEYINNIPLDIDNKPMISRREAFDIQVRQRIITKIKGTEKQFGELIGSMKPDDNAPINSKLLSLFNETDAQNISDFELTKNEIISKAKELNVFGYAN
jgi:hypothetical protein